MKRVDSAVFDKTDESNFEKIESLVRNHFALTQESYDYFKKEMRNPNLDDHIYKFFAEYDDSRVYFELPLETQSQFDNSWQIFRSQFDAFVKKTQCDYSHFKNNKIVIDKNEFKIFKAVNRFYLKRAEEQKELLKKYLVNHINFETLKNLDRNEFVYRILNLFEEFYMSNHYNFDLDIFVFRDIRYELRSARSSFEIKEGIHEFIEYYYQQNISSLENEIDIRWERVVKNRISKENLKLVLSFNYADYFLCSTKENWTSCLALDGGSANYWYGITGLIGDKNRIIAYITDGSTKNYRGIKTDRFIYRSWVLLGDDDVLYFNRWFPNDLNAMELARFLNDNTSLEFGEVSLVDHEDFRTKYPLNPVYNLDGYMMLPYQDFAELRSDLHFTYGEGGLYYKLYNSSNIEIGELYGGDSFSCLGDLIDSGQTIVDAEVYEYRCEDCDEGIRQDDPHFVVEPQGYIVCETCFERHYFTCEDCGNIHHMDQAFNTEGDGILCQDCFEDNYFFCEISDRAYRTDYAVEACDDRNGRNLFLVHEDEAWNNGYVKNESDGIFYKSQYMVYIESQDEYIHIDEVEEGQLELEFEEAV